MKVLEQLVEFFREVESKFVGSRWLSDEGMRVYVRRSMRLIDGKRRTCLDVANVVVEDKGKGEFTRFLDEAMKLNPWEGMYAECVHNSRLVSFFLRSGWQMVGEPLGAPNFFLEKR